MIALLFFQVYWLVGASITSDLKDIRARLEKFSIEENAGNSAIAALAQGDQGAPDYAAKKRDLEASASAFRDRLYVDKISAFADFALLRKWNFTDWFTVSSPAEPDRNAPSVSANKEDENTVKETDYFLWVFTAANVRTVQTAQVILTALVKYILPILYGALGASAYIVRTLASEIKDSTYSASSRVRYELSFYLGAVAGLSIAWFTSEPRGTESAGILQSLSPLALAFLAGYSVELLFSLLDRLVSAFSGPEPKRVP